MFLFWVQLHMLDKSKLFPFGVLVQMHTRRTPTAHVSKCPLCVSTHNAPLANLFLGGGLPKKRAAQTSPSHQTQHGAPTGAHICNTLACCNRPCPKTTPGRAEMATCLGLPANTIQLGAGGSLGLSIITFRSPRNLRLLLHRLRLARPGCNRNQHGRRWNLELQPGVRVPNSGASPLFQLLRLAHRARSDETPSKQLVGIMLVASRLNVGNLLRPPPTVRAATTKPYPAASQT